MKDKKQYRLKRWYPDIPSYMDNGFIIDYYPEDEKAIYTYPNGCILGFSLPAHHLECRDFWELIEEKPKPLFITDDGVNIDHPKENVFLVNEFFEKDEGWYNESVGGKVFFHESNADEYIWKNKRVFSYEDMMKAKHSIILTNEDIEKAAKKRSRNE